MMASSQKTLQRNRSTWNSAAGLPLGVENEGYLGMLRVKIFDPGASWSRSFCVIAPTQAVRAIFVFATGNRGFCRSSWELSQSLTKSPALGKRK